MDSTDWDSLLRQARGCIDPQGVYWLDPERRVRHPSVFSEHFARLAHDEETAPDLPAYRFRPPVDAQVAALLPQMAHREWREPPAE